MTQQKPLANQIVKTLKKAGLLAYFAGGCVRDLIMRKKPKDYDIATTATPDDVERLFPKCVPVGKQFGVMIVILKEVHFEVATFRSEGSYRDGRHPDHVAFTSPEEDAQRIHQGLLLLVATPREAGEHKGPRMGVPGFQRRGTYHVCERLPASGFRLAERHL